MDNALVYEAGDCGSIPYEGTKHIIKYLVFNKLTNYQPVPDWRLLKGDPVASYGPIALYKILDLNYYHNFFDGIIQFKIPPKFHLYVEVTDNSPPHVDPYPSTGTINYIIESAHATTSYWRQKTDSTTTVDSDMMLHGSKNTNPSKIYNLEDLEEVGSFQSHPGDFYLMDASKIHSVAITPNCVRRMISWRWEYIDYNALHRSIKF